MVTVKHRQYAVPCIKREYEKAFNEVGPKLEIKEFAVKSKAHRVHWKCIQTGHLEWARCIAKKYSVPEKCDDSTIAFAWTLMAEKINPQWKKK